MEEKKKHITQEDWTYMLREKLAGYEEPVPEGVWESIEEALPPQTATGRHMVLIPWLRRVAAVVILAVTGAACWYMANNNEIKKTVAETEKIKPVETNSKTVYENDGTLTYTTDNNGNTENIAIITYNETAAVINDDDMHEEKQTSDVNEENNGNVKDENDNTDDNIKINNKSYGKEKTEVNKPVYAQRKNEPDRFLQHKNRHSGHGGRVTAGLYAANTMGNRGVSANGVIMSANVMNKQNRNSMDNRKTRAQNSPMYLANYKEETKHKLPVSVGLSVSYDITGRLWVESGAVYTRLSSDFTRVMNNDAINENHTQHYVGIPLHIGYTAYRRHNISVYGIAGGQADINVKSECETEGLKTDAEKDRVQWSVTAAAGAQYNFLPQVGVYVEPGVKYYPDNGSNVDNIFKDKKLNFSLQLGIRYNINR